MHAPIPAVFSLFVLLLSFFLSILFFYSQFLITLLPWVVPPFWSFFFLGTSLWVLTTLLPWIFPLKCFPPLGLPLSVFFSLPSFFFSPSILFFCHGYLPFYSELIQWDFSFLLLRLHPLFLVCCGHPFKITHPPIGCPNHCHCSVHVYCTTTHFTTKFPFVCSCCIPLPHYLALWHASDGPNHLLLLLDKIPSQQGIFPKEVTAGNQIQTIFSPHHQTTPSKSP